MLFEAVMLIGAIAGTVLAVATVIVVQSDKHANRGRALRADQFLGALHASAPSGRPWRSIYPAAPARTSAAARTSSDHSVVYQPVQQ
jgi:hypothetical protein